MDMKEMLADALKSVRTLIDTDIVIGTPVTSPDGTVALAVSKVNMGFATVMGEINAGSKEKNTPIGSVGGGADVKPIGFLIVKERDVKFVPTDGAQEENKWLNLLDTAIDWLVR